jgi:AraC family transcriptional regulator, transcriptional activator of pobA
MKAGVSSKGNMKTYHFLSNKYGRELLLDIGRIEKIPNFNFGAEPHQLSFYDILFIDKGNGHFMLDDNKIALKPGTIIFTSPGHTRRWHIKKPIGGYAVFFEKDFLNLFFTDELFLYRFSYFHQYQKPTSLFVTPTEFSMYLSINSQIEAEIKDLQNDSVHLLRALLYQLLVLLNRSYAKQNALQSNTYIHPVFFRFRSLLEKNYKTDHRVADYLKLLRISPAQLNKLCRQYMGTTAQEMIHHKQISEAKRLLRDTTDTISEIAYRLNFSDPSNFNRFFRSFAGLSPQQYRQQF